MTCNKDFSVYCFECPKCLPPGWRLNGKMCLDQMTDDERREIEPLVNRDKKQPFNT